MKKYFFICLILGSMTMGAGMVSPLPVFAEKRPIFSNTLSVGGIKFVVIRGESSETVKGRSLILEDRLVAILSDSKLMTSDVQLRKNKTDFAIYVKDQLLITVTAKDAAYNQNSQEKQAEIWQQQFAKTLPLVNVTPYRS